MPREGEGNLAVGIAVIDALQRTGLDVGDHARPRVASGARDDRVSVAERFVDIERGMKSAEQKVGWEVTSRSERNEGRHVTCRPSS